MNGNKSKNALGGGAFAVTLAVVAVMLACPFAVLSESVADTDPYDSIDIVNMDVLPDLSNSATFTFTQDYRPTSGNTSNRTINHSIEIDGAGKTLYGGFSFDWKVDEGESETYDVVIKNLTLDGHFVTTYGYGISTSNEKDMPVRAVNLTLENCIIKNFTSKGLYMTSFQSLIVKNCTFIDNATGVDTNTMGDYAFDVNLIGVQDVTIEITGCTFSGNCGEKSAVKITQRGVSGSSDDKNGFTITEPASIEYVKMSGNTFSTTDRTNADITLGSRIADSTSGNKSYTTAFDVDIVADGTTRVTKSSAVGEYMDIVLTDGSNLTSTSEIVTGEEQTGKSAFVLESGSAVISGYIPSTISLSIAQDATASVGSKGLTSDGMIYTVNNNLSGSVDGKVQNTDIAVNPGYDDDEDLPPYIPSQSSNDDDTVTIVSCAAAASVAAILAVFLVIDRKG